VNLQAANNSQTKMDRVLDQSWTWVESTQGSNPIGSECTTVI